MEITRTCIIFVFLCGTVLSGQSPNILQDTGVYMETSTETPELETSTIHPPGGDTALTLLDTRVSNASLPVENKDEPLHKEEKSWHGGDLRAQQMGRRRRRDAWWRRKQAPTVEATANRIAGLVRPLMGWGRSEMKGEDTISALMTVLKDLYGEKQQVTNQRKAKDDEDDDDDDDDDEEEEEEEEGGQAQQEGQEQEEEEGEEATEAPNNQTETHFNFTESLLSMCQIEGKEIRCRGIGITYLPIIHNLEATYLDVGENNISIITENDFSGLPNLDTLDLSRNELDDESFGHNSLSNLNFLKKLNLDGNRLTSIPALPPYLEVLNMNNNKLSVLTPDSFKGLVNLLNLELVGNTLHEASVSPLVFRPLKRLLDLQLNKNHFRSIPLGLPRSLQRLKMSENVIESMTEESLSGCNKLRLLDLSHNTLHEQSVATHVWSHLKSLEALDLSYNHFTSIPTNLPPPLRKLTLQHNNIYQIPAFAFRHLWPGLQSLQLSHNSLSNGDMGRVSFVGAYRSLGELLLDNNRLDEVPPSIREFKNLRVLRLDNNHIRMVKRWGLCHPRNSGSTLASLHLENNYLEVEKIPINAFSCLIDTQGLVIHPQEGHSYA